MLIEETYYNADNLNRIAAKRFYQYDDNNNIVRIVENTAQTRDVIELRYTYDLDNIKTVEEFLNGMRIKYSVFFYKDGVVEAKVDYDNSEKAILKRKYEYSGKELREISDYLPDGTFLGKRVFYYKDNILISEYMENELGVRLVQRNYLRNGRNISRVDYFIRENPVRIIERKYSEKQIETNCFGYKSNFWDIR